MFSTVNHIHIHAHTHPYTHTHTHVQTANYYTGQLNAWLTFVEISKVKAFVELSIAPSIRMGTQNLLAVSWGEDMCLCL